jgi:hypothetical protein
MVIQRRFVALSLDRWSTAGADRCRQCVTRKSGSAADCGARISLNRCFEGTRVITPTEREETMNASACSTPRHSIFNRHRKRANE